LAIPVVSVVVLVVLFLLLSPDDDNEGVSPATPTTTISPTSSASVSVSVSPSPTPSPVPDRTVIEVTYRDGAVQGPTSFTVTQGDRVRLLVRADVSDEVHFHGYDLSADVTPQDPATIDFVANAAGVYEVELESAGEPLFELKIVP